MANASVLGQFSQLTQAEKLYILTHLHHAPAIKETKESAYAETKRRFGKNGHNDESDAFRHCFWSALLAREIGYVVTSATKH